jgi:hypothetical protein
VKHIRPAHATRAYNLGEHGIFCDLALDRSDLRLILECVRLIDQADQSLSLTLTDNRKATLRLMPDTGIPIVRSL